METLGMLDHPRQKCYYHFVRTFHAYLHAKINFIPHYFLKILQRNNKLVFGVIWPCLAKHN